MKSMTGYSFLEKSFDWGSLFIEIRTLNSSHKDIAIKMDPQDMANENDIRRLVSRIIKRGRVSIFINCQIDAFKSSQVSLNVDFAKDVQKLVNKLSCELNVEDNISITEYPYYKQFFSFKEFSLDKNLFQKQFFPLLEEALDHLDRFRKEEGLFLQKDFLQNLDAIIQYYEECREMVVDLQKDYQKRLQKHLVKVLDDCTMKDLPLDKDSFIKEISIFSEKIDVSEELCRFKAHLDRFRDVVHKEQIIGKELLFILQELFREVNTLSSKCQDFEVSSRAVSMKTLLEKMKEQAHNIE